MPLAHHHPAALTKVTPTVGEKVETEVREAMRLLRLLRPMAPTGKIPQK